MIEKKNAEQKLLERKEFEAECMEGYIARKKVRNFVSAMVIILAIILAILFAFIV